MLKTAAIELGEAQIRRELDNLKNGFFIPDERKPTDLANKSSG